MASCSSREGDRLFEEGRFSAAKALYLQEARKIVGPTYVIPATPGQGEGGVKSDLYINLHPFKFANLVGCCVGMAKCLRHDNDIEMVRTFYHPIVPILTRYRLLRGAKKSILCTAVDIIRPRIRYTVGLMQ
jgi:hypothetical protein